MNIAVVANSAWYLLNFRLNLMRALTARGHRVVAIAPTDGRYDAQLAAAGFPLAAVPISGSGTNPLRELQSVCALRRVLKSTGTQLVLSYTPKGNLYGAMASINCRIPFVPNVSGLGRAFIQRSFVTTVAQMLYRLTFGRAHLVFFQNEDDRQVFVSAGLVDAAKCERLPGSGVDLQHFAPAAVPDRPADAPVFLMVARMLWDKGVGEYMQAARKLRTSYPHAVFRALGPLDVDNPSAVPVDQVQTWRDEGLMEHMGATDDVRPYLADADCVVLPSYREGVPRALLEAAAMARPVITTDAPGCRDALVNGQSGFICKTRDADDLAAQMMRWLLLTPEQRLAMGRSGRAHVEAHFGEHLVIERYLQLVQAVAGERPDEP